MPPPETGNFMPSVEPTKIQYTNIASQPSTASWQQQLGDLIRSPQELSELLDLKVEDLSAAADKLFELRVPRFFAGLMKKGDLNDPLLQQVLPAAAELNKVDGFSADPLKESGFNNSPGLIHKYHGRVLLIAANQCAINCRYCFRRHFPYQDNHLGRDQWLSTLESISKDSSISEVILSGGDPLAQSDKQLKWLTEQIQQIPHVKRLRLHTRLPVVLPDRINDECLNWLKDQRLQTSIVLHINHPQEISPELISACSRLKEAGIRLFNQSVLLKGVNDNVDVLAQLSEDLFTAWIQPYYLHQLDHVAGAAHFLVDDSHAKALYHQLRAQLPGYLVPLLTQEIAGKSAKTPLL